ncbi:MAG: GNAT family N-acetyltransferase [Gemmatimonadota bacterium]|nr:GNAT family N-acetyltransferase [Gemmatimonadota bacterium]
MSPPTIRRSTPADDAALCELFGRVTMDADLVLSVCRDPDFAALYRLQTDVWETWVAEVDGRLQGMGSILVRDGYVDGRRSRVGYLGDLRIAPALRGRHLLNRFYGPALREMAATHGCTLFLTAVIASNDRALRALTSENRRTRGRPRYSLLREFNIRSLHLTRGRRRAKTRFSVRQATEGEVPRIARLLDEDARQRPFGYCFQEAELRRRLGSWPGLAPESFYLAEDAGGMLVGCIAIWDARAVKRMVVREYRGGMRGVKRAYNLAAWLLRFPPLPRTGEAFRYLYLTHQAIPSEDPEIMGALLDAVHADHRRSGYHFLSVCVLDDDPLEPAFRGFRTTDLPAHLYLVTLPEMAADPERFGQARPGFEMALV